MPESQPYNWEDEASREGVADRIPNTDRVRVSVSRIIYRDRHGPFQSKSGDPQIMLVFLDSQDREASTMLTLSVKAGWVLAKFLGCFDPPANLARMTELGILPEHFADPTFADKQLLDRQLDVSVKWIKREGANREYADVTPLHPLPHTSTADEQPPAEAPPPASDPPPTADGPPAPVEADPQPLTRDEAWAAVLASWRADDAPTTARRNAAWAAAVKGVGAGKPEASFVTADWGRVAKAASVPF